MQSPKKDSSTTNQIRLTSNNEVILKRDSSTQTNLTNKLCFNVATQTTLVDEDRTSFSLNSYIDQFEQATSRSNKSSLSIKSNLSNKSSSNNSNCFDRGRSLKHYLLNEAKFAGVYDDNNQYLNSGDSSTELDEEEEDSEDSYANQDDQESLDDEEYEEETNDDQSNGYNDSSYSDDDDLANYFKNEDSNLDLGTKVRLQRMLNAQLEKRKRLAKKGGKQRFNQFDDTEFYDDDDEEEAEVLNSLNNFINKSKSKKDPNDYLETSSFIFLNKSATFDSTDDLNQINSSISKPVPLKRISSKQRELDIDQLDLPDHQAIKNSFSNAENRLIVLPNSSAIAGKAEIIDPTRKLTRDAIVQIDLLQKELPRKPKKELKKKKSKEDKPKPPKRANSLVIESASDSFSKQSKNKVDKSTVTVKNEELEKFAKENIKRHLKKGGLNKVFKRKESLKGMLVWTKTSIKQPMIATLLNDNEIKQEAINCFQLIQVYCGDRDLKSNDLSRTSTLNENLNSHSSTSEHLLNKDSYQNKDIAFKLIDCAITRGINMKDEIFVQVSILRLNLK